MIDAFKIGITVSLINQSSGALAALARDFTKTDVAAKRLEASINRIKLLTVAGGAITALGFAGIKGLEVFYDSAKKYEQALARFRSLNLGDVVNRDADHFAQATRVMGTSATDLVTTLTDLHTVLGNYEQAKAITPLIARMEFANKAVFDTNSKFDDKQALSLAKVIELRGGFRSNEEMARQADFMQHVLAGTGGRVTPNDYLAFMKTGGVAARLMSNDNFYYQMEPLIQELGGSRTGTALMSAYQNLAQGRTTVRAARELQRLGLVNPDMMEFTKTGALNRIKPGGVLGGDLAGSDPMKFLTEYLLPHFASKGITSDKAIINELGTIFTNRTAAALFTTIFQQMDKIVKNRAIDEGAMGIHELDAVADNTPEGRKIKAEKAWENLKIQLGLKIIPLVAPLLDKLANGLQYLSEVAERHPTLTDWLVKAAAGLAAFTAVAGPLVLAVAGFNIVKMFLGSLLTFGKLATLGTLGIGGGVGLVATLGGIAAALTGLAVAAGILYVALGLNSKAPPPNSGPRNSNLDLGILAGKLPTLHTDTALGHKYSNLPGPRRENFSDSPYDFAFKPQWLAPPPKQKPPGFAANENPEDYTLTALANKIVAGVKELVGSLSVKMDGQKVGNIAVGNAVRRYQAAPSDTGSPSGEMTPILNGGH